MRPVSQEFKDAFLSDTPDVKREVSYKRRYWDAEAQTYAWEADWTVLPEDEVESVSPITEQLDSERLNEFKVSNITINLKNNDNKWRSDNPAGVFGPDAASRLYFYSDHWMKFRVRVGVRLQDESYEYTSRFVGLAVEYTHDSQDQVQVSVQGLESILQNTNAEDVSTRVVEENAGTGNNLAQSVTTDQPGVGIVEEVSVGGATKVLGTHYEVADLNDPTQGATINLLDGSGTGTIRVTYKYWLQNQSVEDLVSELLTEAGVAGVDQLVDQVVFPGGVRDVLTQTTQADWMLGTGTNVDLAASPGTILMDFGKTDFKTLDNDFSSGITDWTKSNEINGAQIIVTGGQLRALSGSSGGTIYQPGIYKASTQDRGAWKMSVKAWETGVTTAFKTFELGFVAGNVGVVGVGGAFPEQYVDIRDGYVMEVLISRTGFPSFTPTIAISLYRQATRSTRVLLGSTSSTVTSATIHTCMVTRDHAGLMRVYFDDVLKFSATDITYTSSSLLVIGTRGFNAVDYGYADDLYIPSITGTAEFVSKVQDASASVFRYGRLLSDATADGATVRYYTATSTDGVSFDAYEEIGASGQINSVVKRYIKFKITYSVTDLQVQDPAVDEVRIEFVNAITGIRLANFTGKSVYQAIQDLGSLANYEWGFTPDEDFFFRAKDVSQNEDIELRREVNVSEITGMVTGQDRVYSEVRATYGEFNAAVRVDGDTVGDAKAKYGARLLQVDGGSILLTADADIATGVASIIAQEVSKPRRRFKAVCKLTPHLDLSDVARVFFDQNKPLPSWFHGDTNVTLGDQSLHHFGPKQQLVSGMYAKVIGARHDPDNVKSEFDLQEVL